MQGLLLINKPSGRTSFSVVAQIKKTAGQKRVGHTGTLDPMATGVLPILLGRATVLSSIMLDEDKKYIAKIKLGVTTDTDDITGNIIDQKEVFVSQDTLKSALEHFTGKIQQIPPMYSAIKKDGVRLYKLAREGKSVDIKPRNIEIFEIKQIEDLNQNNEFVIETHVSKGTYIRSLARDIGEYLGCGATLTSLERTYASGFGISDCVDLENLNNENISEFLLDEETAVKHLRILEITEKQAVRFSNGGQLGFERLKEKNFSDNELFRVRFNNRLLGIGIADCEKEHIGIKCITNYPD